MKISEQGKKKLIKDFEGFVYPAEPCPAGVLTVFWGHTDTAHKYTKRTLSPSQAEAEGERLLAIDIARFEKQVARLVTVPLTQSQFDALVSFVFNLGGGALESSTLLTKLNAGDYEGAAKEFDKWVWVTKPQKKKLAGLVRRRNAEREWFLKDNTLQYEPDPNNEPLRNRDLPLPTVMQSDAEVTDKRGILQSDIVTGAGGVTGIASAFSYLDWRVAIALIVVSGIIGGIWWFNKK